MSKHYANYHAHRAAFRKLFEVVCDNRILLLQGKSGSGKTSLITTCIRDIPQATINVCMQFRPDSVGMDEIFARSVEEIGAENFSAYSTSLQESSKHGIALSNVAQHGSANTINVTFGISETSNSEKKTAKLTEAWFSDIRAYESQIVLVFDAYEQAPSAVQDWISGPFLSRVAKCKNMRVAIAGQRVPIPGIEWGRHSTLMEFGGVPEPSEWVPVIREMGKVVPEPAEVFMAGICRHLKGHPSDIMNFIEGL